MRVLTAIFALLLLGAHAATPDAEEADPAASAQEVEIVRDGDRWTADFTFPADSPVWVFSRSALMRIEKTSWRGLSWTVETPGVELKRLGFYDALVASSGTVPRKLRVRFTPYAQDILADYDPALAFTDGSVALYTEHYNAIPLPSEEAAKALPSDLNGVTLDHDDPARVSFRDRKGKVLSGGERHRSLTLTGGNGYVLFGAASVIEAPAIATVLDPQLPAWVTAKLSAFTPQLLDFYTSRLGPRIGSKPTVMVSWAGPTPGLQSMGGSVLPGLIIMRLEGEAITRPDKLVEENARWFIAHESAHFWVGQTVGYSSGFEAWITEGGADLLATRAVAALVGDYDAQTELQKLLDECVRLAGKPVRTAGERGENRAYYACGAMFALAAESSARRHGGDFFSFWRGLIDSNRDDRVVDRSDWLGELTRLTGNSRPATIIGRLLDEGAPEPRAEMAALFDAAAVPYRRDAEGKLLLQ